MITGEEDLRPEIRILLQLLERRGAAAARVAARGLAEPTATAPAASDFAGFEDALAEYRERGFVISSGPGASRQAKNP